MDTITRYEAKEYPIQVESKFVNENTDMIKASEQFRYSRVAPYEMGLTPRYPSEQNGFIFTFVIERHVINENNVKLAKIQIRYAYRLKLGELIPTAHELFEMLSKSTESFAAYFYEKIEGSGIKKNLIKALDMQDYTSRLEQLIAHWEKNLRHLSVDKNGKPITAS